MTGSRMDRPGGDQLLEYVRLGDVLVVVAELSRMTCSLMHLLKMAQALERKQVNLVSLRENIDTNTATGRCFLSMMGTIHQIERELRVERGAAGRACGKGARKDRRAAAHRCRQVARRHGALRQLRKDGGRIFFAYLA
jgi:DNA invertase Pin-like site-specific DNA recombinase